ncbi:MAG: hypothetical protein QUV05_00815 [Phycisphaerae bacterium]|nr:hypothetical protein [Phycisphaerae bacterium]
MTGRRLASLGAVAFILLTGLILISGAACSPAPPPDDDDTGDDYTPLDADIATDTTLPVGLYDLTGTIHVTAGLTLLSGTTIRCQPGSSLIIESTGFLNAVGTAGSPITFTGATQTRGSWGGISFLDSNSSSNRLEYVNIQYGGSSDSGGLFLSSTDGMTGVLISHCTVGQSAGSGLYVVGDVDLNGFASNALTQNAQGPCVLPPNVMQYLDLDSDYTGNDQPSIVLSEGTVTDAQIWADLGVDYQATSIQVAGDLTLSPGVIIAFTSGGAMNVQSTGSLGAVGAPGREIILTGVTQTPGSWEGLSYTNTSSPSNNLTLVTIEYGGATSANLSLNTAPVRVFADNCTFAHSATCGIYVAAGGTINPEVATINDFIDNVSGEVCR